MTLDTFLFVLYASYTMSRNYYYAMILSSYKIKWSEIFIEIGLSTISWLVMISLFYRLSAYFVLLKAFYLVAVYLTHINTPSRQKETIPYFQRVTIFSSANPVETTQFNAIIDLILFVTYFGAKSYV